MINSIIRVLLCVVFLAETIYLTYQYVHCRQMDDFDCRASLVQHHDDEHYHVSLRYMIRGGSGLVYVKGYSESNPEKIFNRKLSFKLQRNRDLYHMISGKNMRMPDDNFSDDELSHYIPRFFITSEKSLYVRILKMKNNNFIFMLGAIPTYICQDITDER